MGALPIILGVFLPRIVMLVTWFMGMFQASMWGVIGWFFMPYTTLAATIASTNSMEQPWNIVIIVLGIFLDMGAGAANASILQKD